MDIFHLHNCERLPVFRECENCGGQGYLQILEDHGYDFSIDSSGNLTMTTCPCHVCDGQGVLPTGDFAYQTPKGIILEKPK